MNLLAFVGLMISAFVSSFSLWERAIVKLTLLRASRLNSKLTSRYYPIF